MSTQKTQGIQALLEAERNAAGVVQEARDYRTKQLRQARDDAKKEIEERKKKAELDYTTFATKNDSGSKSAETAADQEVADRVVQMESALDKGRGDVSKSLLDAVVSISSYGC